MRETETKIELTEEEFERLASDNEGGPAAHLSGWLGRVTGLCLFGLSAYVLYWTQFAVNTTIYRASFLAIVLALVFALFPLVRDRTPRAASIEEWLAGLIGALACLTLALQSGIFARSLPAALQLLVVGLCFTLMPLATRIRLLITTRALDWILVALCIGTALVLCLTIEDYKARPTRPTPEELVLGGALILLVLEATRRTVGWILPAIAILFLIYCYFGPSIPEPFDHRGFSLQRIIGQNALTLEGLFSTPLDVAATFIILFTIYGAVLERGGAGKFFIDWAFALFGKKPSPSAPGRAVVTSGFLLGTVSGSGVATTVTIASLAWPMLRRSGYTPNVAGGMLSAAGIGATLSPPTLGAAAFIIAEYLNVDYLDILIYATIPTLLYYLSCWLMTEADARRLKVTPVKTSDASLWQLTRSEGYHFLSLGAIAVFLILGFTSFLAVFWSIAIAFGLSMIRGHSRLVTPRAFAIGVAAGLLAYGFAISGLSASLGLINLFDGRISVCAFWGMAVAILASALEAWRALRTGRTPDPASTRMIEALIDGSRSVLGIASICACAGIIVSVVNLTGLGLTISSIIVTLGGGERVVVIILAAIAMWILGTAVPVTASYIIAAVMLVPALTGVGVPEPAAHMFLFYYAVLADVSPPTALAPFAAAAITGGTPFRTMIQAWKYTLPAFLVPFMFCLTPDGLRLLMLTPSGGWPSDLGEWLQVLLTTATSCLALVGLAMGATGYALRHANALERILATIGGALLLAADALADLGGTAFLGVALLLHWLRVRPTLGEKEA
ncbi:TRAP transporter fused permease subunit [Labrys sp. KNU-23]|uniref:TRAP transporter permease n=1 Tax=Labrys sp. KNU-23 TaxID=2789216 RepID=UPI0011EE7873|nr:TRAP transporter fused permease subunit [Labrys sp. KNU-23]QEN88194.1 TRAP transporter fused permease subunit [Labrys sp. KNU-23]